MSLGGSGCCVSKVVGEIFRNIFYRETLKMNDNTLYPYAHAHPPIKLKPPPPPNKRTNEQAYSRTFIRINDF